MSLTLWADVVGHSCESEGCTNLATHIHDGKYQCCACHGKSLFTEAQAQVFHEIERSKK